MKCVVQNTEISSTAKEEKKNNNFVFQSIHSDCSLNFKFENTVPNLTVLESKFLANPDSARVGVQTKSRSEKKKFS